MDQSEFRDWLAELIPRKQLKGKEESEHKAD
jgi:hypothetical protein